MKGSWIKKRFGISYAIRKSNSHGMLKKTAHQKNVNNNKRQTTVISSKQNLHPTTSSRKNSGDRNLNKIVGTTIQDKNARLK